MKQTFARMLLATLIAATAGAAQAAPLPAGKIDDALAKKNLTAVQDLLKAGPGNVDEVLKALLKTTQNVMGRDPEFSGKMLGLAGQYAPQMSPSAVPVLCADLRRIVDTFKPEENGSPLFAAAVDATQKFSQAPVVVSAGRPNLCETAFIQIATLSGDQALLAMVPGMRGPGLPPVTIRPGIPPGTTPPTDKPSAD